MSTQVHVPICNRVTVCTRDSSTDPDVRRGGRTRWVSVALGPVRASSVVPAPGAGTQAEAPERAGGRRRESVATRAGRVCGPGSSRTRASRKMPRHFVEPARLTTPRTTLGWVGGRARPGAGEGPGKGRPHTQGPTPEPQALGLGRAKPGGVLRRSSHPKRGHISMPRSQRPGTGMPSSRVKSGVASGHHPRIARERVERAGPGSGACLDVRPRPRRASGTLWGGATKRVEGASGATPAES